MILDGHQPCSRPSFSPQAGPGWLVHLGTATETTESQQRIYDFLDDGIVKGDRIFHVGVGCSTLAQRYARRATVRGCTVHPGERDHGLALGIAGYEIDVADKHDPHYLATLTECEPFDFVVDNNPASFACCWYHFLATHRAFMGLLEPGGRLLHETPRGLNWVASNSAKIVIGDNDLEQLADLYGATFDRPTRRVIALRRVDP